MEQTGSNLNLQEMSIIKTIENFELSRFKIPRVMKQFQLYYTSYVKDEM